MDVSRVNTADFTAVLHINPIDNAERHPGDKIATDDRNVRARHRRIGQPHRQTGVYSGSHLIDRLHDGGHSGALADADVIVVTRCDLVFLELLFNLATAAVYDHQFDTEVMAQCDVMNQILKDFGLDHLARQNDDKRFLAKSIDIGRSAPKPFDVLN